MLHSLFYPQIATVVIGLFIGGMVAFQLGLGLASYLPLRCGTVTEGPSPTGSEPDPTASFLACLRAPLSTPGSARAVWLWSCMAGLFSVACRFYLGGCVELYWALAIAALLLPMSILDIRLHWLPDGFTVPLMFWAVCASPFEPDMALRVYSMTAACGVIFACMLIASLRNGLNAVSGGDVFLFGAAGALFGYHAALPFIILSFLNVGAYLAAARALEKKRVATAPDRVLDGDGVEHRVYPLGFIFGLAMLEMVFLPTSLWH